MRKGRQIDRDWDIRKYKGDIAFYAHCSCGFQYACSSSKRNEDGTCNFQQEITKMYNYCPNCGAHKKYYNAVERKIDKFPWE